MSTLVEERNVPIDDHDGVVGDNSAATAAQQGQPATGTQPVQYGPTREQFEAARAEGLVPEQTQPEQPAPTSATDLGQWFDPTYTSVAIMQQETEEKRREEERRERERQEELHRRYIENLAAQTQTYGDELTPEQTKRINILYNDEYGRGFMTDEEFKMGWRMNDSIEAIDARNSVFNDEWFLPEAVQDPLAASKAVRWGKSQYDEKWATEEEYEHLGDIRANNQPVPVQLGNGFLKMGTTTVTTFLDGTIGSFWGLASAISTGEFHNLYDNAFTRAMKDFTDWTEKVLPNYYTEEEANTPFALNTANFWGDKFIKNLGFTLGAFLASYATMGVGGALLGPVGRAIGLAGKLSPNATGLIRSFVGTTMAAVNEASIEAINNASEWEEEAKARIDEETKRRLEELYVKHLEEGGRGTEYKIVEDPERGTVQFVYPREEEYKKKIQEIRDAQQAAYKRIERQKINMGNVDFALNMPTLLFTEYVQMGRAFKGGFKTAKRAGRTMGSLAKGFKAGRKRPWETKGWLMGAPVFVEGAQEILQRYDSDVPATYYNSDVDVFFNKQLDPTAQVEAINWWSAALTAAGETFTDPSAWEEFAIGALTGALGLIVPRKGADGWHVSWEGGVYGGYKEWRDQERSTNAVLGYLNRMHTDDPKLANLAKSLVGIFSSAEMERKAVSEGNVLEAKNADAQALITAVNMFAQAGKLNDLKTALAEAFDTSDENIKSIIESFTSYDAKTGKLTGPFAEFAKRDANTGKITASVGTKKDVNAVREKVEKYKKQIFEAIEDYEESRRYIDEHTGQQLTNEDLEQVIMVDTYRRGLKRRAEELRRRTMGAYRSRVERMLEERRGRAREFYADEDLNVVDDVEEEVTTDEDREVIDGGRNASNVNRRNRRRGRKGGRNLEQQRRKNAAQKDQEQSIEGTAENVSKPVIDLTLPGERSQQGGEGQRTPQETEKGRQPSQPQEEGKQTPKGEGKQEGSKQGELPLTEEQVADFEDSLKLAIAMKNNGSLLGRRRLLKEYLRKHPNGSMAEEARARLKAIRESAKEHGLELEQDIDKRIERWKKAFEWFEGITQPLWSGKKKSTRKTSRWLDKFGGEAGKHLGYIMEALDMLRASGVNEILLEDGKTSISINDYARDVADMVELYDATVELQEQIHLALTNPEELRKQREEKRKQYNEAVRNVENNELRGQLSKAKTVLEMQAEYERIRKESKERANTALKELADSGNKVAKELLRKVNILRAIMKEISDAQMEFSDSELSEGIEDPGEVFSLMRKMARQAYEQSATADGMFDISKYRVSPLGIDDKVYDAAITLMKKVVSTVKASMDKTKGVTKEDEPTEEEKKKAEEEKKKAEEEKKKAEEEKKKAEEEKKKAEEEKKKAEEEKRKAEEKKKKEKEKRKKQSKEERILVALGDFRRAFEKHESAANLIALLNERFEEAEDESEAIGILQSFETAMNESDSLASNEVVESLDELWEKVKGTKKDEQDEEESVFDVQIDFLEAKKERASIEEIINLLNEKLGKQKDKGKKREILKVFERVFGSYFDISDALKSAYESAMAEVAEEEQSGGETEGQQGQDEWESEVDELNRELDRVEGSDAKNPNYDNFFTRIHDTLGRLKKDVAQKLSFLNRVLQIVKEKAGNTRHPETMSILVRDIERLIREEREGESQTEEEERKGENEPKSRAQKIVRMFKRLNDSLGEKDFETWLAAQKKWILEELKAAPDANERYLLWEDIMAAIRSASSTQQMQSSNTESDALNRLQELEEDVIQMGRELVDAIESFMNGDSPKEARRRGWRKHGGSIVHRQGPVARVEGRETTVEFASRGREGTKKARFVVMEADELQPSHHHGQENPNTFLNDAQPKNRAGDNISEAAAGKIAKEMDPARMAADTKTAYTGAPVVNERGEVIQGNNRAEALKVVYERYGEQSGKSYKEWLVEHAKELGLDPQKVAAMQNPVLVRMLDVTDEEAVVLGQYTASDTETGGKQFIRAQELAARLSPEDMDSVVRILIGSDETEANLTELIAENGPEVLRWLAQKGKITDTVLASSVENGGLTAEAKIALRDLLIEALHAESDRNAVNRWYSSIPGAARKAIASTLFRNAKSPKGDSFVPLLREAMKLYYALKMYGGADVFKKVKTVEDFVNLCEFFASQASFDEVPGATVYRFAGYSKAAMTIAAHLHLDGQRTLQNAFNNLYTLIQSDEDTLFEKANPRTLSQAVKEVFGVDMDAAVDSEHTEGGKAATTATDTGPRSESSQKKIENARYMNAFKVEDDGSVTDATGEKVTGTTAENVRAEVELRSAPNPTQEEATAKLEEAKRKTEENVTQNAEEDNVKGRKGVRYMVTEEDGKKHVYQRASTVDDPNLTVREKKRRPTQEQTSGRAVNKLIMSYIESRGSMTREEFVAKLGGRVDTVRMTADAIKATLDAVDEVLSKIEKAGGKIYTGIVFYHKTKDGKRYAGKPNVIVANRDGTVTMLNFKTSDMPEAFGWDEVKRGPNKGEKVIGSQYRENAISLQMSAYHNLIGSQLGLYARMMVIPFNIEYTQAKGKPLSIARVERTEFALGQAEYTPEVTVPLEYTRAPQVEKKGEEQAVPETQEQEKKGEQGKTEEEKKEEKKEKAKKGGRKITLPEKETPLGAQSLIDLYNELVEALGEDDEMVKMMAPLAEKLFAFLEKSKMSVVFYGRKLPKEAPTTTGKNQRLFRKNKATGMREVVSMRILIGRVNSLQNGSRESILQVMSTILHETSHAVLIPVIEYSEEHNTREMMVAKYGEEVVKAVEDIDAIYNLIKENANPNGKYSYAFSNVREFVADFLSKSELRRFTKKLNVFDVIEKAISTIIDNISNVFKRKSAVKKTRRTGERIASRGADMQTATQQALDVLFDYMERHAEEWAAIDSEAYNAYEERRDSEENENNSDRGDEDKMVVSTPKWKESADKSDIEEAISSLSKRLGVPIKIARNIKEVTSKKAIDAINQGRDVGAWIDLSTGEMVVYMPNTASVEDAVKSVYHEAVGHYGLRAMFGSEFHAMLDKLYDSMSDGVKSRVLLSMKEHGWDKRTATEEYLSKMAEDFANSQDSSLWRRIKAWFKRVMGLSLSDEDLRVMLYNSYRNLTGRTVENAKISGEEMIARDEQGVLFRENFRDLSISEIYDNILRNREREKIHEEAKRVMEKLNEAKEELTHKYENYLSTVERLDSGRDSIAGYEDSVIEYGKYIEEALNDLSSEEERISASDFADKFSSEKELTEAFDEWKEREGRETFDINQNNWSDFAEMNGLSSEQLTYAEALLGYRDALDKLKKKHNEKREEEETYPYWYDLAGDEMEVRMAIDEVDRLIEEYNILYRAWRDTYYTRREDGLMVPIEEPRSPLFKNDENIEDADVIDDEEYTADEDREMVYDDKNGTTASVFDLMTHTLLKATKERIALAESSLGRKMTIWETDAYLRNVYANSKFSDDRFRFIAMAMYVRPDRSYSVKEIRDLFYYTGTASAETVELAELIFDAISRINSNIDRSYDVHHGRIRPIEIRFTRLPAKKADGGHHLVVRGRASGPRVAYSYDHVINWFDGEREDWKNGLNAIIVHELIHSITANAIANAYLIRDSTLRDAVGELIAIYNMAKDANFENDAYGMKDEREFVAEMSEDEFRDKLKGVTIEELASRAIGNIANSLDIATARLYMNYALDSIVRRDESVASRITDLIEIFAERFDYDLFEAASQGVSIPSNSFEYTKWQEDKAKIEERLRHASDPIERVLDKARLGVIEKGTEAYDRGDREMPLVGEAASPLFYIGEKRKDVMRSRLKKAREKLQKAGQGGKLMNATDEEIETTINEIEKIGDENKLPNKTGNPKLEEAALHWALKGTILLPNDSEKVVHAVELATKANVDPTSFDNPQEIIEKYTGKFKEKPVDPATLPHLHFEKQVPGTGVTIYNVEDNEDGRRDMYEVIRTHIGKDGSPWCLLKTRNGVFTANSSTMWYSRYNAHPKRVAFSNGRLVAFFANDTSEKNWWDRLDNPTGDKITIIKGIKMDELHRIGTYLVDEETGPVSEHPVTMFLGNNKNGALLEWTLRGKTSNRFYYVAPGELKRSSGGQPARTLRISFYAGSEQIGSIVIRLTDYYDDGTVIERDNDGNITSVHFKDWDRHVVVDFDGRNNITRIHSEGSFAYEMDFKDGKPSAYRETYNGGIKEEVEYRNGLPVALRKYIINQEGSLVLARTQTYNNKGEVSNITHYGPDGSRTSVIDIADNGSQTIVEYDTKGKLFRTGTYDATTGVKLETFYYPTGKKQKIRKECRYEDGELTKEVDYKKDGQIERKLTVKTENGKKVKTELKILEKRTEEIIEVDGIRRSRVIYNLFGKESEEYYYEDGSEEIVRYYEDFKTPRFRSLYVGGKLSSQIEYYRSGKKKTEVVTGIGVGIKKYLEDGETLAFESSYSKTDKGTVQIDIEYYEDGKTPRTETIYDENGELISYKEFPREETTQSQKEIAKKKEAKIRELAEQVFSNIGKRDTSKDDDTYADEDKEVIENKATGRTQFKEDFSGQMEMYERFAKDVDEVEEITREKTSFFRLMMIADEFLNKRYFPHAQRIDVEWSIDSGFRRGNYVDRDDLVMALAMSRFVQYGRDLSLHEIGNFLGTCFSFTGDSENLELAGIVLKAISNINKMSRGSGGLVRKIRLKFTHAPMGINGEAGGGVVRIGADRAVSLFATPLVARTVLHELIHVVTHYAIRNKSSLRGDLREAVEDLSIMFETLRQDESIKDMYGSKNVSEFIAELANPKFRRSLNNTAISRVQEKLATLIDEAARDSWTSEEKFNGLVGAAKRFDKSVTPVETLKTLLKRFIDNFDAEMYTFNAMYWNAPQSEREQQAFESAASRYQRTYQREDNVMKKMRAFDMSSAIREASRNRGKSLQQMEDEDFWPAHDGYPLYTLTWRTLASTTARRLKERGWRMEAFDRLSEEERKHAIDCVGV